MNDDDWNMYRGLNADDISEDENDELALNEIELELRDIDESKIYWLDFEEHTQKQFIPHYLQNYDDKIVLYSELVKCNEIFFQPSLIGIDQGYYYKE